MDQPYWPGRAFSWVPREAVAHTEAAALRGMVGNPHDPIDLLRAGQALRVSIRRTPLDAPAGGTRARLGVRPGGGGWVLVDPRPAPGELDDGASGPDGLTMYERFRIAHEFGHLLFYDCGGVLWTRMRAADAAEEAFCDAFARALLLQRGDGHEAKDGELGQSTSQASQGTQHAAA